MRFSSTFIGFLAASAVSAIPLAPGNLAVDAGSLKAASHKLNSLLGVISHGRFSIDKILADAKGKDPFHIREKVAGHLKEIETATVSTAPAIEQDLAEAPKVVSEDAAEAVKENVNLVGGLISNMEGIVNKLVNSEVQGLGDLLSGHVKLEDAALHIIKPIETFVGEVSAAPGSGATEIVEHVKSTVDDLLAGVSKLKKGGQ